MPSSTKPLAVTLRFPLYRTDDETSAVWTNHPVSSAEQISQFGTEGETRTFSDRAAFDAFVAELSDAVRDGGDPIYEDAEFLASVGIALPEGMCHDPADFPLADVHAVHPATAAVNEFQAKSGTACEALWTIAHAGKDAVTIHPPVALLPGQIEETERHLGEDFTGATVQRHELDGFTFFLLTERAEAA